MNSNIELLYQYISKIIQTLDFSTDDIENEIDFYYECEHESNSNDTIYHLFYKCVDLLSYKYNVEKFDATHIVADKFNEIVKNTIIKGNI